MLISWTKVANANSYRHYLDDNEPVKDKNLEVKLTDLPSGKHTYTVVAIPNSASKKYTESEPATVSFEIVGKFALAEGEVTYNSVQALLLDQGTNDYYVGIVPRSDSYMSDADLISYVNSNSSAQRKELKGLDGNRQEVFFSGLQPNTHYVVVAYDSGATDTAYKIFVCTNVDPTPGTKGNVFPFGVSTEKGYYDVDKLGDISRYNSGWTADNQMCWACTSAGMIAWWLDDYKLKTGEAYKLTPENILPEKSACYVTPVMDIFASACNNYAGAADGLDWFMTGIEVNEYATDGDVMLGWRFNENYKYWKGGFMGMTREEARSYLVTNASAHYSYDDPKDYNLTYNVQNNIPMDCTEEESARLFSEVMLDALKQGPSYLSWGGMHAIACWGAEYEVNAQGTPIITYLYMTENSPANDPDHKQYRKICPKVTTRMGAQVIYRMTNLKGWRTN